MTPPPALRLVLALALAAADDARPAVVVACAGDSVTLGGHGSPDDDARGPSLSEADDYSLAYSFLYGADDGGANGGDAQTLVGEHCDVSLVVVEPVSQVPGLQVYDTKLRTWLGVEGKATPGKELVLFGGNAFAHATGIPACRHRVVKARPPRPRHVFLYEQKYAAFFAHLRQFGD